VGGNQESGLPRATSLQSVQTCSTDSSTLLTSAHRPQRQNAGQRSVHDMCFALICRIARKSTRRPEEEGRELRQQSPQPPGSAQQSHIPVLQGPCAAAGCMPMFVAQTVSVRQAPGSPADCCWSYIVFLAGGVAILCIGQSLETRACACDSLDKR